MISIKPNFTVLGSGRDSAIKVLQDDLAMPEAEGKELNQLVKDGKLKRIKIVDADLGPKRYEISEDKKIDRDKKAGEEKETNYFTLRISKEIYEEKNISDHLKQALDSVPQTDNDKSYDGEIRRIKETEADKFNKEEKKSQASIEVLSEILDRAYNRRTTLTGWILLYVFQYFGFEKDDFGAISEILHQGKFAQVYTSYKKLALENKSDAEKYLATAFQKSPDDKTNYDKERKLVKTASFLIDNYNNLNMSFVQWFPKVFCYQNVAMPFLKWLFPKVKLFDFMVCINPWVYDLVSENMGNYAGEIGRMQDTESGVNEKVVSEIGLTELGYEEFSLQKVIGNINQGFGRIFGKNSTVAAQIFQHLIGDYKSFANRFLNDTAEKGFIRELYEGIKPKPEDALSRVPKERFNGDRDQFWVSRIILSVTNFVRSVTPEWITESTNTFGAIFVPLNLTMPILAKIFHKGFLGFVTHTALKVFPLANELFFDHLGNFRKEMLDIKSEISKKPMAGLFPPGKISITDGIKSLYSSVLGFFKRKSVVATEG